MATSETAIIKSNFSTTYAQYTNRFYATDQYYYVRAESWGMRAEVNSALLNDWHGSCQIFRWTGSSWAREFNAPMQDTSSRKSVAFKCNADSLNISGASILFFSAEPCNLWRVYFEHTQWGGNYGIDVTFYIGTCGTTSDTIYDNYLKLKRFYSNGTIGKSQCGLLSNGTGAASDATVLSYFNSNTGTPFYASYDRHCVGALRTA